MILHFGDKTLSFSSFSHPIPGQLYVLPARYFVWKIFFSVRLYQRKKNAPHEIKLGLFQFCKIMSLQCVLKFRRQEKR